MSDAPDNVARGPYSYSAKHDPGASLYLPEDEYFYDKPEFARNFAARVTDRCVAKWASWYQAFPVGEPSLSRQGRLPNRLAERSALIDTVVEEVEGWIEANGRFPTEVGLILKKGSDWILDQHDGIPGHLFLTPSQFEELQGCWQQAGIPVNLYYPAEEQRTVIEPVEMFGGLVRSYRAYSPLRWARRDTENVHEPRLPTEEERTRSLVAACSQFQRALLRYSMELQEPGKTVDEEELKLVFGLVGQVGLFMIRLEGEPGALGHQPDSQR